VRSAGADGRERTNFDIRKAWVCIDNPGEARYKVEA
jgi:hypothetical protein